MTPAKGKNSSRRKGKEIVSDAPAKRDVGEEAVYSKLDYFDKEEAWCAPDSECAFLIDPWYTPMPISQKFPVIIRRCC